MAVLPPDPVFNIRAPDMGPVHSLCFHQDERLLAGTENGTVHLWDLQTNRSAHQLHVGSKAILSLSSTDEVLVTQEKGGITKLWALTNSGYDTRTTIITNHPAFCRNELIQDRGLVVCPKGENEVSVFSLGGGEEALKLSTTGPTQLGSVSCLKSADINGQLYIMTGYESGDLLTWDLRVCKPINQEHLADDCLMAVDYDPYTNRGVCAGPTDKIAVFAYQKPTMEISKKFDITIKNAGINCLKIRADQKVFASAGWDGRIRVFSWKSLRPLAVLTEHKQGGVMDLAYSNGKVSMWNAPIMAAAGMDCQITLWDLYN